MKDNAVCFINNHISTFIFSVKQNVITICKLKLYVCFYIHLIFCILFTLKSNFLIFEHKCRFSLLTPLFVLHNKGIARNITIDAFKLEADGCMNWPYYNHAWIYFPVSYIASGNVLLTFSCSTFILYLFKIQPRLYRWIP